MTTVAAETTATTGSPERVGVLAWVRRALGRETSGRAFIPQVDGLRFFAIAAVMALHFADQYHEALKKAGDPRAAAVATSAVARLTSVGNVGVQLFFAISGFVLAVPFARRHLAGGRPVELRTYLVRRVTRIEPPYVINLLVLFGLQVFVWHYPGVRGHAGHLLASLGYVHNRLYHGRSTVNGVAWSLEIEVQFYLLAPLLTQVFRLRPAGLRRAVIGAAIVGFALLRPHLPPRYFGSSYSGLTLAHQIHYFLVGFLLADLFLVDWARPSRRPGAWDAVAFAGWAGLLGVLLRGWNLDLTVPWLTLAVYAAAFRGRTWTWVVCRPFIYLVGGMCYTIYLYHWWIGEELVPVTARLRVGGNYSVNCLVQVLLLSAVAVAISSVLFVLLEKPFMRRDWTQQVLRWVTGRRVISADPTVLSGNK